MANKYFNFSDVLSYGWRVMKANPAFGEDFPLFQPDGTVLKSEECLRKQLDLMNKSPIAPSS